MNAQRKSHRSGEAMDRLAKIAIEASVSGDIPWPWQSRP